MAYFYHSTVLEKKTKKIETEMYGELIKIEPPENSKLLNKKKFHKSDNALAFSDYYSDLTDAEIIDYYHKRLQKGGWSYCCNDDDQINKEFIFQKDDLTAHLYIKKERTKDTKTYRLSIAWRLFSCNECK